MSSTNTNPERVALLALIILAAVAILPLLILSYYVHPTADDILYTNYMRSMGVLKNLKYQYFNWSGRYLAHILYTVNPLSFRSDWAYKFNTFLWTTLHIIATYWLCGKVFDNISRTLKLSIASLITFSYLIFLPFIGGVFWQTCLYTLFTANILTMLLLGSIIEYYNNTKPNFFFALSCILAMGIIGLYEVNMVYIDIIVFTFFIFAVIKKQKIRFPLSLLLICIIFSIVSVSAPGNYVRGNLFPKAHRLAYSLKQSYVFSFDIIKHNWMPFMFLIGIILSDILEKTAILSDKLKSIFSVPPLLVFIACLLIPFLGFFISYYSEGSYPADRFLNEVYFYFILTMLYFTLSVLIRIKERYPNFKLPLLVKITAYLLLLYTLILYPNNIKTAYKDVFAGTAVSFDKQLTEREKYLSNSKCDSCMVEAVKQIPASFYFLDVQPDPHQWYDTNLCRYYHKKYIGLTH